MGVSCSTSPGPRLANSLGRTDDGLPLPGRGAYFSTPPSRLENISPSSPRLRTPRLMLLKLRSISS
ncbi:hypothetical protein EI94DRAFT_86676 [Lactarius quietus]|nr:hypothetical protein EI94DRAFT_86676 [Lactarius quietus]